MSPISKKGSERLLLRTDYAPIHRSMDRVFMTTKQKCGVAEQLNSCVQEIQLFNFGWKTG
jgi:hypothetical protein